MITQSMPSMPSMPPSESRDDTWERRVEAAYGVVPYVLLAASTILAVLETGQSPADVFWTLGVAVLVAAWMLWMITLHPGWTERRGLMLVYYVGLLAGIALLISRSPWFGIFASSGYIYAFICTACLPHRWAFAGVAATAVLTATAQRGGIPQGLPQPTLSDVLRYLLLIALNAVLASVFTYLAAFTGEQSQRRKHIIAELAEANQKLADALEENAGLHAQLLTQAREAGVLDERQRMAREIHDTLAQGFTGIIAQLEAAKRINQRSEQWRLHVDQAQTLARESLTEARRSVQALRPAPLEQAQLPDAIADMARRWSRTANVALSVESTGEPRPLPAEVEVSLFRVAQEALTNVAKHARASRVGLTLSYLEDVVLLDIRDDGAGFDTAAVSANGHAHDGHDGHDGTGFGLSAMRQRLRQVDGTLEIESAPGEGTAINASVPVACAEVAEVNAMASTRDNAEVGA